jgi:hypothetical protein
MNSFDPRKILSFGYLTAIVAVLSLVSCTLKADDKKKVPPAPPAPKATPAPKPAAPTPKPGGRPVAGPTTTTHGPTTANPGPTAKPGPTTNNAGSKSGPAVSYSGGVNLGANNNGDKVKDPIAGKKGTAAPSAKEDTHESSGPKQTQNPPYVVGERQREAAVTRTPLPKVYKEVHTPRGDTVVMRHDGGPAIVHDSRRGMDIHHRLDGRRRVEVSHGDRVIVVERGRPGWVGRRYEYNGRVYEHRTYFYHGRAYDHFYRGYEYHGVVMQMYTPAYYYAPAFYGWAYNPWATPIPYAWFWAGYPWYAYYGAYFSPYPVYASPSLWLTDYLLSTSLAAAYEARIDADAAVAAQARGDVEGATPLTPEVKTMIAAEVQRQIAIENAESTAQAAGPNPRLSGVYSLLNDHVRHVFVAGTSIDVVDASGTECAISEGDALQLIGPPAADATSANLIVLASKGGQECRAGSTVSVAVTDLQDMQNHMRETIDQGMSELQSKQGKDGLPAIPASAAAPPAKAAFAAGASGPDPGAEKEIVEQSQEADQAEKEILSQAGPDGPEPSVPSGKNNPPPVPFLAPGKSFDQITAEFGQPKKIIALGPKTIYLYDDKKVIFQDGKVTDVQ